MEGTAWGRAGGMGSKVRGGKLWWRGGEKEELAVHDDPTRHEERRLSHDMYTICVCQAWERRGGYIAADGMEHISLLAECSSAGWAWGSGDRLPTRLVRPNPQVELHMPLTLRLVRLHMTKVPLRSSALAHAREHQLDRRVLAMLALRSSSRTKASC